MSADRIISLLTKFTSQPHLREIQAQLIHHNLHANTAVAYHFITAASRCSSLLHSTLPLFLTQLTKPHVFTCNTLIKAFSHLHTPHLPYSIYAFMLHNSISPSNYTFPFLLKSLSDSKDLRNGQLVHTHVVKFGLLNDIYVQNALLDLYVSCGGIGLCCRVFDEMPVRDVVSWTVLIMGYRNCGKYDRALVAFRQMQKEGVVPNRVTMVNVLGACGSSGAVEIGDWIYDFAWRHGWELDVILGTSLIDMYLKCGRIDQGLSVFDSMKEKNAFTWNSVIKGFALAKSGQDAVWYFHRMQQEGFMPDEVTLVSVLSACSHSGLIHIGRQIFSSLIGRKYGYSPGLKHYACMMDLLARAGSLNEAFKLITEMPFQPTKSMWGSLLAGSRAHGNLELSEFVAKKLVEMEPDNSAYYIVLSNLYAEMGRWNSAAEVRELMKERGLQKDLGSSSVQSEHLEHHYGLASV